ncbi:MAG: protein kinase [Deltaproteobacteria bacterium]|nr:protein kinase [Deltaproteobacteria bacterium]
MIREGTNLDGRYKLLQAIGAGGMGSVWLAEKITTYEKFAIKFIHQHALGDESYYARFTREVQVLRGLRHPNIVDVFDWSIPEPGKRPQAYVVMELLEGVTLQDVIRQHRRLPVAFMNRVMLQVLDGISAVHAMGIIHRDMSPANIYLVGQPNAFPRVKILDFGLAKGIGGSHADSSVTQPGSVLGRAAYAAPEIFIEQDLDVRADIFACGMIFYRSVVGRFPYKETKVDLMWAERYAERNQSADYPPPSRFVSDVPQPIERIIMRSLRRRPSGRFGSAMEMQQELLRADGMLAPAQREAAGRFLSLMRDPDGAASSDGGTPSPGPFAARSPTASRAAPASPAASAPTVPPLAPGPSVLSTSLSGPAASLAPSAPSVVPAPATLSALPPGHQASAVGTLVTGSLVFTAEPAEPAEPVEVGGEAGSTTISATPLPAAQLPLDRPTFPLDVASAAGGTGRAAAGEAAAGGSTPSVAAPLAGDVSSSIGSYHPARGLAVLWRRPAVLAAASVGLALLVVGTLILLRDRGTSSGSEAGAPAGGSALDAGTPADTTAKIPTEAGADARTFADVPAEAAAKATDVADARREAAADTAPEAKPDVEAAGEDAGRSDDAAAEDGAGLPIKPLEDAGPGVAADARADDAAAPPTDAVVGTTRTDAAVVRPPRDAAVVRPPADAAVRREAGGGAGTDDFITDYPGTRTDAGSTTTRDTGATRPPSDDFITDYPGQRRDAGATRPPSDDDFVTNYGSGSTP